jgi:FkbM family methyltransferase
MRMFLRNARWRVRSILRPHARKLARAAMGYVPLEWLLKTRDRYSVRLESGPVSVPRVLRASRFRIVPPSIATYSPPGRPDLVFANASSAFVQTSFWSGINPGGHSVDGAQVALWEALCRRAREIVEIGANVGQLTVPGGLATTARYRAVEPHPETASVLRRNVELNGLVHVEVVEAAAVADDSHDAVELALPPSVPFATPAAAAVDPPWADESVPTVRVSATPVVELVANADLIKLDVEGMELPLLRALESLLVARRPTMMIEVLDGNAELKRWLSGFALEHSWKIFAVTAAGNESLSLADFPAVNLLARYGTRDVLVVPS